MKTQNQIRWIKIGYVLTLASVTLFSVGDVTQGLKNGFSNKSLGTEVGVLQGLLMLSVVFLGLRMLSNLYSFISSVEKGDVFSKENIGRLKHMGWVCTIIPFLIFLLDAFPIFNTAAGTTDRLLNVTQRVNFQVWPLIFGFTLLTIAFVFKKGVELKHENDLTI